MTPPRRAVAGLLGLWLCVGCGHLQPVAASGVRLRVMSYNIAFGHGDLERTAQAIASAAPDLVALQEVDVHWAERSRFADQAATLAQRLKMQVRFAPIYQLPGASPAAPPREFGVALLSRYPIVSWANHRLTRLSTQEVSPVPAPQPGFLEAVIDVDGLAVRFFSTHTDYRPDPRVRAQQAAEMLAVLGDGMTPTVLCGDLNAPPDAPELQPLLRALRDAWPPTAGPGLTYPSSAPVRRIDYILTSRHFAVTSAWVPESDASDHRPVVADLELHRSVLQDLSPAFVSLTGVSRVESLSR